MKRIRYLLITSFLLLLGGFLDGAFAQNGSPDRTISLKATPGGKLTAYYEDYNPYEQETQTVYVNDGEKVPNMTQLAVMAKPSEGYKIGKWYLDGVEQPAAKGLSSQQFTIRQDTEIKVEFESSNQDYPGFIITYDKTVTGGKVEATYEDDNYNTIPFDSGFKVPQWKMMTFKAIPDEGYEFDHWTLDGKTQPDRWDLRISAEAAYKVSVVFKSNKTIETRIVEFSLRGQRGKEGGKLIASVEGKNISSGEAVEMGKKVTFKALPDDAHLPNIWYTTIDNSSFSKQENDYKGQDAFELEITDKIKERVKVEHWFKETPKVETKTVTFSVQGGGGTLTATVDGKEIHSPAQVEKGKKVLFTATPDDSHTIDMWFLNGNIQRWNNGQATFEKEVVLDVKIEVSFEEKKSAETRVVVFEQPNTLKEVVAKYWPNGLSGTSVDIPNNTDTNVPVGSIVTLDVKPIEGWMLENFLINDNPYKPSPENHLQFTVEASASEYYIDFDVKEAVRMYKLTFNEKPLGGKVSAYYIDASMKHITLKDGAEVPAGASVVFSATADEGYEFDYWTKDRVKVIDPNATAQEYMTTMDSPCEVQAVFKKQTPTSFLVNYSVDNGGSMKSAMYYDKTSHNYVDVKDGDRLPLGTEVDFEVELQKGYVVDVWYLNDKAIDASKGKTTQTIAINADSKIRVALVATPKQKVTYTAGEGGKISAAVVGQAFNSGDEVMEGSYITFTATPDAGYSVDKWVVNGDEKAMGKPELIERLGNAPLVVSVSFKKDAPASFKVTFPDIADWGSVMATYNDANGQPINVYSNTDVPAGSKITFKAMPNEGYVIDSWMCNDKKVDATNNEYTIEVKENINLTIVAHQLQKFAVTFNEESDYGNIYATYIPANSFGTATDVYPGDELYEGTEVTFEAQPKMGYVLDYWKVNGDKVDDANKSDEEKLKTIVKIEKATTVEAIFKEKVSNYKVTFDAQPAEGGKVEAYYTLNNDFTQHKITSNAEVPQGAMVTFTETANQDYKFVKWIKDGADVAKDDQMIMKDTYMVSLEKDLDIKAVFEKEEKGFTITFKAGEGGSIKALLGADKKEINNNTKVPEYSKLTFVATPDKGFVVDQWIVNGQKQAVFAGKSEYHRTAFSNLNVEVSFKAQIVEEKYAVNYTKDNDWGTLEAYYEANKVRHDINPGDKVEKGYMVRFKATVKAGYEIDHWTYNGAKQPTINPTEFTVTIAEDITVAVVCKNKGCTITFDAVSDGGTMKATYDKDMGFNGYKTIELQSGEKVAKGTEVTFVVTLNAGYELDHWLVNNVKKPVDKYNKVTLRGLVINEDTNVKAVYKKKETAFAVTFTAGEGGSIKALLGADKTPINSNTKVESGSNVTFVATPKAGYAVASWTINGREMIFYKGKTEIIETIKKATTVNVTFEKLAPKQYQVSFTRDNSWGTLSVNAWPNGFDGNAQLLETSTPVNEGTIITFDAILNDGYKLKHYLVNGEETAVTPGVMDTRLQITLDKDIEVEAVVEEEVAKYMITFNAKPKGGSVKAEYQMMENGQFKMMPLHSGDMVPESMMVTLTPTADKGYEFDHWMMDAREVPSNDPMMQKGNVCLFEMTHACDVQAVFKKKAPTAFAVTFTAGEGGKIEGEYNDGRTLISSGSTIEKGKELRFTAIPNDGYLIDKWFINDAEQTAQQGKRYILHKVEAVTSVKVTFKKIPEFKIQYTKDNEWGTLSAHYFVNGTKMAVEPQRAVRKGVVVLLDVKVKDNYELLTLTANGQDVKDAKKFTVDAETTIEATFKKNPEPKKTFAVTIEKAENGTIEVVEKVDLKAVEEGTTLTLKATPAKGYELETLTANGKDIKKVMKVEIKEATTLKATFKKSTAIETVDGATIHLYPNPATNFVRVDGTLPHTAIMLYTMEGRRLLSAQSNAEGSLTLDLSAYNEGVYLLLLDGNSYRLVIRR